MAGNGQPDTAMDGATARWPGRVLTALDLRQSLNGAQELHLDRRTIVTPSAADELRVRGVRIIRSDVDSTTMGIRASGLAYALERPEPQVHAALAAHAREGVDWRELPPRGSEEPCRWARAIAERVTAGEWQRALVFCADAGLVCCVANKVKGVRSVDVTSAMRATRAVQSLAANVLVVEVPGPTFFELRQILRVVAGIRTATCPPGLAGTLKELDGHAHR
jgi:hypothetical protein